MSKVNERNRIGGGDDYRLRMVSEARERMHAAEDLADKLAEALRAVEWVNHGDHNSCPGCGNYRGESNHHPECPIRIALTAYRERKP